MALALAVPDCRLPPVAGRGPGSPPEPAGTSGVDSPDYTASAGGSVAGRGGNGDATGTGTARRTGAKTDVIRHGEAFGPRYGLRPGIGEPG